MKLIITEKPSVAQSIAAVLGARQRQDGYLEGGGYLVSWCLGHLVETAAADAYDPAYSKWQMDDLPILPEPWQYVVTPDKKAQFTVLQALMQRDDVESIVCATDAGREGELIFRLVYKMANCRKPIERLWISSMEESAIEDGFANLRPGAEYDSLYAAALCRSKADWLVGINATRLFSTLYHRTLNVGRVMTPTLALVVERESAIENFKKQKFYTVELDCGFRAVSDRFEQRKEADKLCAACEGQSLTVTAVEQTQKTARPPKLYDLTTLQRDGNRLFGYTAQQVLDYAQALYEKKLLTYPRTDSNYLTEDMADGIPALAERSAKLLPFAPPYAITDVGRVIDSSKVSDHHALLPTMQVTEDAWAALPAGERNVLTLVMVRLLCAICEIHRYEDTAIRLEQDGAVFTASGRMVQESGWRATEKAFLSTLKQKSEQSEQTDTLPTLVQGQTVSVSHAVTKEGSTTPPKHFTEDTLLSAMEHASAEDFAEIEGVERTGLGTPATRAGVLEKLVKGGFLERKNRQLLPTKTGHNLVVILPESIKSAKLTAEWESALKEVEHGTLSPDEFLSGIQRQVSELVACYKNMQVETELFDERESVGACPRCGGSVVERKLSFQCIKQGCGFTMWKNDRFFKDKHKELTKSAATALLKKGRVKMSGLFSEKKGTTYDAIVVLADTGRYVNYKLEFEKKPNKNTAGKE
ncbi:MAG: DNA topoisomerase 3 [Firmicutes bacterium]|nr:DNA topoisomerase 3 [Bacillota bacterium]